MTGGPGAAAAIVRSRWQRETSPDLRRTGSLDEAIRIVESVERVDKPPNPEETTPKERFLKACRGVMATIRMRQLVQDRGHQALESGGAPVFTSSGGRTELRDLKDPRGITFSTSTGKRTDWSAQDAAASGVFPSGISGVSRSRSGVSHTAGVSRLSKTDEDQAIRSNVARQGDSEPREPRRRRHSVTSEMNELDAWHFFSTKRRRGSANYNGTLCQERVHNIITAPCFDSLMGLIIVLNLGLITWDQALRLRDDKINFLEDAEHAFLVVYILECGIRLYVWGWECFKSTFIIMDFTIVALGVVTAWIIQPLSGDLDSLGPLLILRIARLLRLVRAVRLLIVFQELWMLVRGLINALRTMVYTGVLLAIMLYAFGTIGLEILAKHSLVTRDDPDTEFKAIVDANFSDLPTAMLTLLQFVSFDNIVYIYSPLVKRDWTLIIFFMTVIMVLGIVLMNLVTAVIVNSALEQAIQDKDLTKSMEQSKRKKLVKEMRNIFIRLDQDGSGDISREEIQNINDADREVLLKLMGVNDPLEIFDALDVDCDEELGIDEFVDGVWQVVISNTPLHIQRMEKQMNQLRIQIETTHDEYMDLWRRMDARFDQLSSIGRISVNSQASKDHAAPPTVSIAATKETLEAQALQPPTADLEPVKHDSARSSTLQSEYHPGSDPEYMPHWAHELVQEVRFACRMQKEALKTSEPGRLTRRTQAKKTRRFVRDFLEEGGMPFPQPSAPSGATSRAVTEAEVMSKPDTNSASSAVGGTTFSPLSYFSTGWRRQQTPCRGERSQAPKEQQTSSMATEVPDSIHGVNRQPSHVGGLFKATAPEESSNVIGKEDSLQNQVQKIEKLLAEDQVCIKHLVGSAPSPMCTMVSDSEHKDLAFSAKGASPSKEPNRSPRRVEGVSFSPLPSDGHVKEPKDRGEQHWQNNGTALRPNSQLQDRHGNGQSPSSFSASRRSAEKDHEGNAVDDHSRKRESL